MAQIISHLQVSPGSPISLVLSQPATTVSAEEHCLCGSPTVSLSSQQLQVSRSLLVRDWLSCSGRGESSKFTITDLALPQSSCRSHSAWRPDTRPGTAAAVVPSQVPGTLPSLRNLLTVSFSMPFAIFAFQILYKLGFHWLFTLLFRRSARCPSWVHNQVPSTPTYVAAIFQSLFLVSYDGSLYYSLENFTLFFCKYPMLYISV